MFWKRRTYLDRAAGVSGNPSSPHEEGRRSREILEGARADIAKLLEVQADDVIFTSGATESNALAILGTVRSRQKAVGSHEKIHALYLPSAHASIVENVRLLEEEGVEIEELPIRDARVDTEKLAKMLRDETVLVAMEAVCGETGVVWNAREVAEVVRTYAGIPEKESAPAARPIQLSFSGMPAPVLHVDASQAPLTEKMMRAHFGADTLVLDASKVCTARGIGALVAHRTIPLVPLYRGGEQERELRPGSEAPELAREFADGLLQAARGREAFRASAERERVLLIERITRAVPDALVNGGKDGKQTTPPTRLVGWQAPHILNISFPGRDTDYLVALLDEAGFAVSTRSACETDSGEGSRAVFALTSDRGRARATLRVSWGPRTRSRELARFAKELAQAVAFVDRGGNG